MLPRLVVDVGVELEIAEGDSPRVVTVDGRELILVRWQGVVYALRNSCPHQSQSFLMGAVRERIIGGNTVGELAIASDDPVLVCPVHGWEFRLNTGQCTSDPKLRVKRYPVSIAAGRVLVDMGPT